MKGAVNGGVKQGRKKLCCRHLSRLSLYAISASVRWMDCSHETGAGVGWGRNRSIIGIKRKILENFGSEAVCSLHRRREERHRCSIYAKAPPTFAREPKTFGRAQVSPRKPWNREIGLPYFCTSPKIFPLFLFFFFWNRFWPVVVDLTFSSRCYLIPRSFSSM